MTFTDRRDATWRWLSIAPPVVVLSICLSAVGALASWTWLVAGEVREQQTVAAVALEKAESAKITALATAVAVDMRLTRLEDKIDRLIEAIANLRAVPSTQPPRPRSVDTDKDMEKSQ